MSTRFCMEVVPVGGFGGWDCVIILDLDGGGLLGVLGGQQLW